MQFEELISGLSFSIVFSHEDRSNSFVITKQVESYKISCCLSSDDCGFDVPGFAGSYQIDFIFQNTYLEQYQMQLPLLQIGQYKTVDMCCNAKMILFEIINQQYKNGFRTVFLTSKALGLLLSIQDVNSEPILQCNTCKFLLKPIEKEKIYKAKSILLSRISNPPTIPELSMEIGINQCYLKKGFKEIYRSTIFDFVQKQRMLEAKLMLTSGSYSVSEVASKLGYSSLSNFSLAFKRQFGVNPSQIIQNTNILVE